MRVHDVERKVLLKTRRVLNKVGVRRRKVFAIGFNKCATNSLHSLFTSLGLPSYHGVKWRGCDDLNLLRSYDCFSDGTPEDLAKLDELFPCSKYILQVRDLESWIYSRLAHIERGKEKETYKTHLEWDTTEYAVKAWIKQRNEYHIFVLSYFAKRPSDIIVVNFISDKSAGTKVANFLGYRGTYERPERNVNSKQIIPAKHTELVRKCVADLEIPENELKYDIYCPSLVGSETQANFPVDSSMLEMPKWKRFGLSVV